MTRIRYIKQNGTLVSTKPILCNNRFVQITLNVETMRYKIVDSSTNELIVEGSEPSVHQLKRKAKDILKSIGATFLDEVRNTHEQRKLVIEATNN